MERLEIDIFGLTPGEDGERERKRETEIIVVINTVPPPGVVVAVISRVYGTGVDVRVLSTHGACDFT